MIDFFDIDYWREVWHTIAKNKGRSLLTAFRVFWGIFIFVLLKGFGDGVERKLHSMFVDQAQNLFCIWPNKTLEAYHGFQIGRYPAFYMEDMYAVEKEFPDVEVSVPMVYPPWNEREAKRGSKKFSFNSFCATVPEMEVINPPTMLEGRYINAIDVRQARKVCIIGEEIKNALYSSGESAVGSIIWLGNSAYMVIGVAKAKGGDLFFEYPRSVLIPVSTAQKVYGIDNKIHVAMFALPPGSGELEKDIEMFLRERWEVSPTDRGGVWKFNTKDIFDQFSALFTGINFLTYLVGMGTLLAGIVGVCNIMLVTVRERTQEIGVKRALGATPAKIIRQIMSESLLLSLLAGLSGIIFGVIILTVADLIIVNIPDALVGSVQLAFGSAIGAVLIITALGCLAGLLPSYRAVSINAIDALRDE